MPALQLGSMPSVGLSGLRRRPVSSYCAIFVPTGIPVDKALCAFGRHVVLHAAERSLLRDSPMLNFAPSDCLPDIQSIARAVSAPASRPRVWDSWRVAPHSVSAPMLLARAPALHPDRPWFASKNPPSNGRTAIFVGRPNRVRRSRALQHPDDKSLPFRIPV